MNSEKEIDVNVFAVAPKVWGMKDIFVNLYMIGNEYNWVLVDTGLRHSAKKIKSAAGRLFGKNSKPDAIILTHGHFDHTGSAEQLSQEWNVPVYAHYFEMPFLTGMSPYPPPDATAGGGLVSIISSWFPKGPISLGDKLQTLPAGGSVPGLPDWMYIHTPGHTMGHISLFRKEDGVLIAGDAFSTTKSESIIATFLQLKKLSGPPSYFTYDWKAASKSVQELMMLDPEVAATGHGKPMHGAAMRKALFSLCVNFDELAVPRHGRYVNVPAVTDEEGIQSLPPRVRNPYALPLRIAVSFACAGLVYFILRKVSHHSENEKRYLLAESKKEEKKFQQVLTNGHAVHAS